MSLAALGSKLAVLNRIDGTISILQGATFKLVRTVPHVSVLAAGGDELALVLENGDLQVGETTARGGPAPAALVLSGQRLVEADATGAVYVLSPLFESGVTGGRYASSSIGGCAS